MPVEFLNGMDGVSGDPERVTGISCECVGGVVAKQLFKRDAAGNHILRSGVARHLDNRGGRGVPVERTVKSGPDWSMQAVEIVEPITVSAAQNIRRVGVDGSGNGGGVLEGALEDEGGGKKLASVDGLNVPGANGREGMRDLTQVSGENDRCETDASDTRVVRIPAARGVSMP